PAFGRCFAKTQSGVVENENLRRIRQIGRQTGRVRSRLYSAVTQLTVERPMFAIFRVLSVRYQMPRRARMELLRPVAQLSLGSLRKPEPHLILRELLQQAVSEQ